MWFKHGIISDSKPGFARVIFPADDNMVSDWLPICYPFTMGDQACWIIKVNSLVSCLMDQRCEEGVILGAIYNQEDPVPTEASSTNAIFKFEDGSIISYDKSSHELLADIKGKITAKATGNIKVESSMGDVKAKGLTVHIEAVNITLSGAVMVEGVITAGGLALVAMPSITGSPDGKVTGDINVTGSVKADTDVKVGTISLKTHQHTYASGGGTTSTPI